MSQLRVFRFSEANAVRVCRDVSEVKAGAYTVVSKLELGVAGADVAVEAAPEAWPGDVGEAFDREGHRIGDLVRLEQTSVEGKPFTELVVEERP